MTLAAGSQLGPYEIVSQLGAGGMGVVYQARDPRLDRHVAIKLLPPDLTRDDSAKQRFLQEAKAASALDHPNICTIHEINETADGQLYLVMAHYEGETLKARISRGPLEPNDAIDIATQVGEGLAEAHKAGIVHRDIKPANLFVTKAGVVKILDFGLAKLAGAEGVTETGTTVGTVAYMSPEQLQGEDADQRSDVWSLGVVLFEMVSGQRPFKGERLEAISVGILQNQPPSLTVLRAGVVPELDRVVTRTLVKKREERYQAVHDLLGDLRKLHSSPSATSTPPDVPSIAVLPFVNMSADPEQEYFCDGLAEELIDALARLEGLRVVGRTSSFQFRGKGHDLRGIGDQLKARTVLEGSVRKAGNRLRINAQLINTADGYHLWSERYDRDIDDIFAVQDDIAQAVVEKLKVKLLGADREPLVRRRTENIEAYNLFLQGRYYSLRTTAEAFDKARDCFSRALALEPTYAEAQASLARVRGNQAAVSLAPPRTVMPEVKEAALKAIALDENVAAAHEALAFVLQFYDWDWAGAEREFRRAIELNPGDAWNRTSCSYLLATLGRADESIAEARSALDSDPLQGWSHMMLAHVLVQARRFEEAVTEAHAAIELDPSVSLSHMTLGWGLASLGRRDEAVEVFRKQVNVGPGDPLSQAFLGWALGLNGQREEALAIQDGLERRRRGAYVGGTLLSWVCLGLGDLDQAISWLEQAEEDRDSLMTHLSTLFFFDPLRSDPRFQALLQRMNFPTQT